MKLTKEQALKTIRDAEHTEFLMYASEQIDLITHVQIWGALQHMHKLAEKSSLSEFEGEP